MIQKKIVSTCLALLLAIVGLALVGCDDPIAKIDRSASTATTIGSPESRGFVKVGDTQYRMCEVVFDVRDPRSHAMVFGKSDISRGLVDDNDNTWRDAVVYYRFDLSLTPGNAFDQNERDTIRDAGLEIESKTGIRFVLDQNLQQSGGLGPHWNLFITKQSGYGSQVNATGELASSILFVGSSGREKWYMVHELCHVLGLWHEMQRGDRDEYVIPDDPSSAQVQKITTFPLLNHENTYGTPFDFDSIMLYGVTLKPPYDLQYGSRGSNQPWNHLSLNDIYTLKRLYGKEEPSTPAPPVTTISTTSTTTTTTTIRINLPVTFSFGTPGSDFGNFNPSNPNAMTAYVGAPYSTSNYAIINYPSGKPVYGISGKIRQTVASMSGQLTVGGQTVKQATTTWERFNYEWSGNREVRVQGTCPSTAFKVELQDLTFYTYIGSSLSVTPLFTAPPNNSLQHSSYTPSYSSYQNQVVTFKWDIWVGVNGTGSTLSITLPSSSSYIVVGELKLDGPITSGSASLSVGGQTFTASTTPQLVALEWSGSNLLTLQATTTSGNARVLLTGARFYTR